MSSSVESAASGNVIERAGHRLASVVERWMPSPFLFAIILSYVVFVAGVAVEGAGPAAMVTYWYEGFWAFLAFAMQMVLILMTGFVIAYHPRVNAGLQRLTKLPKSGAQAVVLVGVFAMVIAWVHWGISIVAGAIFAREMGKTAAEKDIDVHYPLLCVASYMGMGLTWHWGLSASAPLLIATTGNEFVKQGVLQSTVPPSQTIFSTYALALTALGIGYTAIVLYVLSPVSERAESIHAYVESSELGSAKTAADGGSEAARPVADGSTAPADRIDNSRLLGGVIALTGALYVAYLFATQGLDALGLDVVNFGFLFVGLLVYLRPAHYRRQFGEAANATSGIILLFPFFAGIQGMMNGSGLSQTLADSVLAVSTEATFPVVAWIVGGIVNLFVPSGGGEWIVLGPPVIAAAQDLGVPVGQATIAYAVGDAHTNLLNPFWALPVLAITGIRAREMFGYSIAVLLALIPFLALALYLVPY